MHLEKIKMLEIHAQRMTIVILAAASNPFANVVMIMTARLVTSAIRMAANLFPSSVFLGIWRLDRYAITLSNVHPTAVLNLFASAGMTRIVLSMKSAI